MSAVWLFVYGSLRRDAAGSLHPLLSHARFAGAATVSGVLYQVDWYPGLVPNGDGTVHGELYELPLARADRMLQSLDDYEGGGFVRRKVGATLDDAAVLDAWAYTYMGPVHMLERIASGDFGVAPEHRAHP
jgi:gamma-glutamylcyclotransferase (GGCT)/AIG2-like uncharacterized protein YtfP